MQDFTSREIILRKIRQSLIQKKGMRFPGLDWEKNIYVPSTELPEEEFAYSFTRVGGHFIYCENANEFIVNLSKLSKEKNWDPFYCMEDNIVSMLKNAGFTTITDDEKYPEGMVAITGCEALISRLGSVLVSSGQGAGRRLFVTPTVHIVYALTSQIVRELKDGLQIIKSKYEDRLPSYIATLTGPSRTADIEKTLVSPAHGPRDIFVFLVED